MSTIEVKVERRVRSIFQIFTVAINHDLSEAVLHYSSKSLPCGDQHLHILDSVFVNDRVFFFSLSHLETIVL